jgi:hypothetical protein
MLWNFYLGIGDNRFGIILPSWHAALFIHDENGAQANLE